MKNPFRLLLFSLVLIHMAHAQTPDPSFGKQGNAFVNFVYDPNPDHIDPAGNRAIAVQPDGKILMAFIHNFSSSGEAGLPGENGFSVMRLHPDGRFDSSFGIDGVKVIAPGAGAYLHFMNLQSDGKILLGGTVYPFEQQLIIYRLLNDGRLDSSFNNAGYARLSPAGSFDYSIGDVIRKPDGKYLLLGEQNYNSTSNKVLVTQLKENGTPDSSYGVNGNYLSPIIGDLDGLITGVYHQDGKLTIAVSSNMIPESIGVKFIRLKPDGTADSSYADNGINAASWLPKGRFINVIPGAHDKLYVGMADYDSSTIIRFLHNGAFDSSFGTNGQVRVIRNGNDILALNMELLSDSVLVVAGNAGLYGFKPGGQEATDFGSNGFVSLPDYSGKFLASTAANLFVYGSKLTATSQFNLWKFALNGSPDNTWGPSGLKPLSFGGSFDYLSRISILSNGQILASGHSRYGPIYQSKWFFKRFHSDGLPDNSFGNNGTAESTETDASVLQDVISLPDDSFIATGLFGSSVTKIRKYLPDGNGDAGFGVNGSFNPADYWPAPTRLTILKLTRQQDGKILYAGRDADPASPGNAVIGRLKSNGTPDSTFGVNGIRLVDNPFGNQYYGIRTIVTLPGNGILVASEVFDNNIGVCEIRKLKQDGSDDSSYGTNGRVYYSYLPNVYTLKPNDLVMQPDGKLLGSFLAMNINSSIGFNSTLVVRFHPNGTIDSTFGVDGTAFSVGSSYQLQMQVDGRILVAAIASNGAIQKKQALTISRFKGSGEPDSSFGINGILRLDEFHSLNRDHFGLTGPTEYNPFPAILLRPDSATLLAAATIDYQSSDGWFTRMNVSDSFPARTLTLLDTLPSPCNPIKLFWRTRDEAGASYFVVERSLDSINFKAIATVQASGITNGDILYHYDDHVLDNSFYFYRIRLFGTVGSYILSGTIKRQAFNTASPSVTISTPATSICAGATVTFTASPVNGGASPTYQWQVNQVNVGTNTAVFTTSSLAHNDQVRVIMTSSATCVGSAPVPSNAIVVTVTPVVVPSISISGNTTVVSGQTIAVAAAITNGGTAPAYQWQDSTSAAGWNNIPGATSSVINYVPAQTGHKLRCVLTSNAGCASPANQVSNTLSFIVNFPTSIDPVSQNGAPRVYPVPATSVLVIDSLKTADRWQYVVIYGLDGSQKLISIDIRNRETAKINVGRLSAGVYLLVFTRSDGTAYRTRFLKM